MAAKRKQASRFIQIAVANLDDGRDHVHRLYALDEEGRTWIFITEDSLWVRLPDERFAEH